MQASKSFLALAFIITAATALLAGCSSPTVSDADPEADFSSYASYAFLSDVATDKAPYETLERTHLKAAVGREMNARGYLQDNSNPDLLVNFAIETQEKLQSRTVPTGGYGIGYDPFFDVYTSGWGMSHTTRIDQYTEGTLEIDLIDVGDRKMIWQGRTKGRLTQKDMQNYQSTLDEAVTEIFKQFPASR